MFKEKVDYVIKSEMIGGKIYFFAYKRVHGFWGIIEFCFYDTIASCEEDCEKKLRMYLEHDKKIVKIIEVD